MPYLNSVVRQVGPLHLISTRPDVTKKKKERTNMIYLLSSGKCRSVLINHYAKLFRIRNIDDSNDSTKNKNITEVSLYMYAIRIISWSRCTRIMKDIQCRDEWTWWRSESYMYIMYHPARNGQLLWTQRGSSMTVVLEEQPV